MNTTDIPFNKFLGLQKASEPNNLLELIENKDYENHLGTVHASAQFALAEASSGEYLLHRFREYSKKIVPVVRHVEVKYKKPAKGNLYSQATLRDDIAEQSIRKLETKGRAIFPVMVEIKDTKGNVTMVATVEWFVQTIEASG